LLDLWAKNVRLEAPAHVRLTGKARKTRVVPLMASTVTLQRTHMEAHGLIVLAAADRPVFSGRHGRPMSRSGIRYLLAAGERRARGLVSFSPFFIWPTVNGFETGLAVATAFVALELWDGNASRRGRRRCVRYRVSGAG
jgi:hypothetical protein